RKRGAGEEAGGADWQTIMYEGYAPNGVAVLIECLTDNRNRAATSMFLISRANILPRRASTTAFLCLVVAHLEWPLIAVIYL
ncbi:YebC/PmpR family DNA-binding transcriptional regulator, partial [Mycobacterium tuberculosis]|uniref:YebC/PmpR family DNA-binding transcriptional regulator n=1 Tax=Mycobacterium tuberculosis TaxID=1773 RepID=UPI003F811568